MTLSESIPGLTYVPELLTVDEQTAVLTLVDRRPWSNELRRRVQHYGYRYNYKARRIDKDMFVGPLPGFGKAVANRLISRGLIERPPDQLIVNEYLPGQGIGAHIDCEPCFADTIVSVSLGWDYEMEFSKLIAKGRHALILARGSALVLSGEARYEWTHCIKARYDDHGVERQRRVSLTFRNVLI